jgi:hypothetical protein
MEKFMQMEWFVGLMEAYPPTAELPLFFDDQGAMA